MAGNDPKGEVELTFGSTSFWLTPTFGAQRLIERDLGIGLMELADKIQSATFGIGDVFVVFKHGLEATTGEKCDDDALGDMIARAGLKANIVPLMEFVSACVNGWGDEEKKLAAVSNE